MRVFHLFMLGLIGSLTTSAIAAPMFSVINLGDMPGGVSDNSGYGINDYGQAVGLGLTEFGIRGFLWTPTTPNGSTGSMISVAPQSQAYGVNSLGQVTGVQTASGVTAAFVWTPSTPNGTSGTRTSLGTLPGGTGSRGEAINGFGQVTGSSTLPGSAGHPFLWTPSSANGNAGTMIDLGLPVGTTSGGGAAINAYGQVVGNSASDTRAFLWTPTTPNGQVGALVEITGFAGVTTSVAANGINASGQIAGTRNGTMYRWTPTTPNGSVGTAVDLGKLSGQDFSIAKGINDSGAVVGINTRSGGGTATLWTPADGMMNLNLRLDASGAGWFLREARAINNSGQIVGIGSFNGTTSQAFLLTPTTLLPEPASLGIIAISALVLRRRSRLLPA
jgi:probable HAF family extracellular repeat protein